MTIQLKIALWFTIICSLVIIGLSSAIYYFTNANGFQDFYVRLELRANIAAKVRLDTGSNNEAFEEVRNQYLQRLPSEQETILPAASLLSAPDTGWLHAIPKHLLTDLSGGEKMYYRDGFRFFSGIPYNTTKGRYAIILSADHPHAQHFLNSLKRTLIIVNIIAAPILFLISFLFSRNILSPIRRIAREVNEISATSLNKRLTVEEGSDEIAVLGTTFNNMLGRLETSFETQNNFVSNASHELNTPLTAIIGEAELALSRERTAAQYAQSLQVILQQGEKLRNITRSLLELAQSGFSNNLAYELVNLDELAERVLTIVRSIYPDCKVEIDRSLQPHGQQLVVEGHFYLLELCLSNILLNACKYASGGTATLALATSHQHAIIIVRDQGIGIPEQDLPYIFDPFFRASNVRAAKGYGIGLPLAQNIVKLHKGSIHIASKESEGTEVIVRLPRRKSGLR